MIKVIHIGSDDLVKTYTDTVDTSTTSTEPTVIIVDTVYTYISNLPSDDFELTYKHEDICFEDLDMYLDDYCITLGELPLVRPHIRFIEVRNNGPPYPNSNLLTIKASVLSWGFFILKRCNTMGFKIYPTRGWPSKRARRIMGKRNKYGTPFYLWEEVRVRREKKAKLKKLRHNIALGIKWGLLGCFLVLYLYLVYKTINY